MLRAITAAAMSLCVAAGLSGCASTTLQGYADRDLPQTAIRRIAVYVAAPPPLAVSFQSSVMEEGPRHQVETIDALALLPPTRTYSNDEVKKALNADGVDAVLIVRVANSEIHSAYAGTMFTGRAQSNTTLTGIGPNMSAQTTSTMTAQATPIVAYSRQTAFAASLFEVSSGRVLWTGQGEVNARGRLGIADSVSTGSAVQSIFGDFAKNGILR